jgi:hypothetical protein
MAATAAKTGGPAQYHLLRDADGAEGWRRGGPPRESPSPPLDSSALKRTSCCSGQSAEAMAVEHRADTASRGVEARRRGEDVLPGAAGRASRRGLNLGQGHELPRQGRARARRGASRRQEGARDEGRATMSASGGHSRVIRPADDVPPCRRSARRPRRQSPPSAARHPWTPRQRRRWGVHSSLGGDAPSLSLAPPSWSSLRRADILSACRGSWARRIVARLSTCPDGHPVRT